MTKLSERPVTISPAAGGAAEARADRAGAAPRSGRDCARSRASPAGHEGQRRREPFLHLPEMRFDACQLPDRSRAGSGFAVEGGEVTADALGFRCVVHTPREIQLSCRRYRRAQPPSSERMRLGSRACWRIVGMTLRRTGKCAAEIFAAMRLRSRNGPFRRARVPRSSRYDSCPSNERHEDRYPRVPKKGVGIGRSGGIEDALPLLLEIYARLGAETAPESRTEAAAEVGKVAAQRPRVAA